MSKTTPRTPRKRRTLYPLPYEGFPLSPHPPTNRWYKTISGHRHYFGKLADWRGALERYQEDKDDLMAGRTPRRLVGDTCLTLADLRDLWLTSKLAACKAGDLAPASFSKYQIHTRAAVKAVGAGTHADKLTPADFGRIKATICTAYKSPTTRTLAVTLTKMMFRWGVQNEHIKAAPNFGSDFTGAPKRARAAARREAGRVTFEPHEIRRLLKAAGIHLRAMVLLGINCAMTQAEIAALTQAEADLKHAIINTTRPKTGELRTCPLWPETIAAIRKSMAERREPADPRHAPLLFLTQAGNPWLQVELDDAHKLSRTDSIGLLFSRLAKATGVTIKGFGKLRHTFRTAADEANDLNATLRIMGHGVPGISEHYVRSIDHDRLVAVSNKVRSWLYAKESKGAAK